MRIDCVSSTVLNRFNRLSYLPSAALNVHNVPVEQLPLAEPLVRESTLLQQFTLSVRSNRLVRLHFWAELAWIIHEGLQKEENKKHETE